MTPTLRALARARLLELQRRVGAALLESRSGRPGDALATARAGADRVAAELSAVGPSDAALATRAEVSALRRRLEEAARATSPALVELALVLAVGAIERAREHAAGIPDHDTHSTVH